MAVPAQSSDLKDQATKEGLLQVLIKVSGDPQIDQNPVIKASLKRADYYVQEFNYLITTPDAAEYLLRIHYDPSDVNRLLKKAGVTFWSENRPLILMWIAVTDQSMNTKIISHETSRKLFNLFDQQSKKYGLPSIFPLMDINDMNQV